MAIDEKTIPYINNETIDNHRPMQNEKNDEDTDIEAGQQVDPMHYHVR
jgi:hypothetical protein